MPAKDSNSKTIARVVGALAGTFLTIVFLFNFGSQDRLPPPQAPQEAMVEPPASAKPAMPIRRIFDEAHRFEFAHENIMGTSLDLTVIADNREQARGVEARIIQEIRKREKLISTYLPDSEISEINTRPFKAGERIKLSQSLWLLLDECRYIAGKSDGAFNAYAGGATTLWSQATDTGKQPAREDLDQVAANSRKGFRLSTRKEGRWVERRAPGRFDFDGIGKGYVIDKCVREALDDFPSIRGLKLDIGGEIKLWGQADYAQNYAWRIGIADPRQPAENAAPLSTLEIRNLAVATSGGYAQPLRVGEHEFNHILDPRTARPVAHVLSATVVAASAQRADALATALCVMPPDRGIAMIENLADAACLIVAADGTQFRSSSFAAMELSPADSTSSAWPGNHVVDIRFRLVRSETKAPFHRHYVGAWVENEAGRRVRLLALWAKSGDIGYVRDLDEFWRDAWVLAGEGSDTRRLLGISRATRAPGEYSLTWDGLNDTGQPVPQGIYTVHLDVNREKGPPAQREHHTHAVLKLRCGADSVTANAPDQPELKNVMATYGPIGGGEQ